MFVYEKKLQYPVKIKNPNPKLAAVIISQYGGPDGELGASLRYLSQRYSMPYAELKGLLTDIGTEELGHLEMVGTIVHQLTRNLSDEDIRTAGFDAYFVDHTTGVYPTAASGFPWSAGSIGVTGDMIADLTEDLAAEQKARLTYDNILRLSDDPDVNDAIKFLRAREIVHFQRFGEGLRLAKDRLNEKNVYFMNPSLTNSAAIISCPRLCRGQLIVRHPPGFPGGCSFTAGMHQVCAGPGTPDSRRYSAAANPHPRCGRLPVFWPDHRQSWAVPPPENAGIHPH